MRLPTVSPRAIVDRAGHWDIPGQANRIQDDQRVEGIRLGHAQLGFCIRGDIKEGKVQSHKRLHCQTNQMSRC